MKRFFSWLREAWFWSLLGICILSLILWFEGPLLVFDGSEPFAAESVRWYCIAVFFLLWGASQVWRYVAANRAQTALTQGLTAPAEVAPGVAETAAELASLRQRLQAALALMKKTRRGGLYHLPWYMFVGVPGAGKTTALVQSGLTFPLADSMGQAALGGVGGTRNCEWWFTDEAVLLDTAGRYTSQDSYREVDQAAWLGFLQLLRKHRRQRPLNGVIVTLSVADLLQQTGAERQVQAQAIRARIQELHTGLGIRFPIYVMLTKCDLLPGFVEFFAHLSRAERAQVWGMTFALTETQQVDPALAAFNGEFQLLEQQLQAQVLSRVQQERDPQRRALVCGFAQHFAVLGPLLDDFLQQVFAANLYEEKALLRGVYFTSGTQEGSPVDRVMGALADAFGLARQVLPPHVASGRSYFITQLLREVIFPEANLVAVNLDLKRRRYGLQWSLGAGLALLFVLLGMALFNSYYRNQEEVREVKKQVSAIAVLAAALPSQIRDEQLLPILDQLRDLPGGYAQRDQSVPWAMQLGLSQRAKLGEGGQLAYQTLLRDALLPRILSMLEQQLRRQNANNDDYLYETLRVYLMLGELRHFDRNSVQVWLDDYWVRNGNDVRVAQALSGHAEALLEQLSEAPDRPKLNTALVSATRLTLARMPLQQRIYNNLKRELSRAKLAEFSVSSAAGRDAPQALIRRSGEPLTRGVNGMFSLAGYRKFLLQNRQAMLDVAQDSWVLAQQEAVSNVASEEQIRVAVSQLYFSDYIKEWDAFLADVAIAPFSTLEQGARVSAILSGPESPLRKLLQAAAKETTLEGTILGKLSGLSVGAAVKDRLDGYQKRLARAIDLNPTEVAAPVKAVNPVDLHFDDLHKMASGAGPLPLDAVLAQLKDVAAYLDAAAAAKRSGAPAPPAEAMSKLKRDADGKPAPLGAMLKNIDGSAVGLTSGSERERLNSLWVGNGGAFCRAAIAARYPLLRSAAKEVTPDDFGKFFAPGGIIDDFFQKNLMLYVDMGGKQWHWRSTAQNAPLGMAQEVLDSFQRAAYIRDAFFSAGGKQVSLRFELRPLSIDPVWSKLILEIDGQQLTYLPHTPQRAMAFQLPSGKGNGQVRFDVTPDSPRAELHTDGSWAWFRMMDKGRLEASAQSERYTLAFDLDSKRAVFELNASSVINPFQRAILEQFHCPASL